MVTTMSAIQEPNNEPLVNGVDDVEEHDEQNAIYDNDASPSREFDRDDHEKVYMRTRMYTHELMTGLGAMHNVQRAQPFRGELHY